MKYSAHCETSQNNFRNLHFPQWFECINLKYFVLRKEKNIFKILEKVRHNWV